MSKGSQPGTLARLGFGNTQRRHRRCYPCRCCGSGGGRGSPASSADAQQSSGGRVRVTTSLDRAASAVRYAVYVSDCVFFFGRPDDSQRFSSRRAVSAHTHTDSARCPAGSGSPPSAPRSCCLGRPRPSTDSGRGRSPRPASSTTTSTVTPCSRTRRPASGTAPVPPSDTGFSAGCRWPVSGPPTAPRPPPGCCCGCT